jgi:hypothetical protein
LEATSRNFNLFAINGKDNGDPEFYLEGLVSTIIAAVCFAVGMIYKNKDLKNTHI